jgi:PAS domain-containing protein
LVLPKLGVRWRLGDAQPEKQEDGSILWHGFITDITERKQSEERRRLNARVFETVGEAIMVTDAQANIVAVNPAFCRITGYSEAEVLGKNPRILNSDRHNKAFHQAVWHALHDYGEWAGEIWNRRTGAATSPSMSRYSAI